MISFRSDPIAAARDVYESDYYRYLPVDEREWKYPFHPLDAWMRAIADTDLIPMLNRTREHLGDVFWLGTSLHHRIIINVVRFQRTDPPTEMSTSWTCGDSIILQSDDHLVHECCHILQRRYPAVFDDLYRQWGFHRIPRSRYDEPVRRWDGILNPDTFSLPMDYAYVDPNRGDWILCFYDRHLRVISVIWEEKHETFARCETPWIVFMDPGLPVRLNHPHEMMAEWVVARSENFFTIADDKETEKIRMMDRPVAQGTLPDLRVCVCTDPLTKEKTVSISPEDAPVLSSPHCVCAMTHEYPHDLFCTPCHREQPPPPKNQSSAWEEIILPPFFVASIVLAGSILLWLIVNAVQLVRNRKWILR